MAHSGLLQSKLLSARKIKHVQVDYHDNDLLGFYDGTNPSGHAVRFHASASILSNALYIVLKNFFIFIEIDTPGIEK